MIDKVKTMGLYLLTALVLLLGIWSSIVSHQFTKFKESIHDQVQQAKNEKQRIEDQHKRDYDNAQAGYAGAITILNDRLRNTEAVSRSGCVRVANQGGVGGTVSEAAGSAAGVDARLITYQGTCSIDFYRDAMRDNLQCAKLLEHLR